MLSDNTSFRVSQILMQSEAETGNWLFKCKIIVDNTGNVRITQHWGAFVQPLLQWKNNNYYIFWMCVCGLSYSACNARAPYCRLCPVRLYSIFPHYLIHGTIFEKKKKVTAHKRVLIFYTFAWNISCFERNWARYDQKVYWSSCKVPAILVRF